MYLVSIYFDEKTTSRIQGYITQVAKRSGNPFMIEKNVPPHLTISAFETRSEDQVISLFEETRDMFQSGEIIWCSVGAFFPNVLYLSPVLNTYLQELSEKVYKELLRIADARVHKCYRPMQWVPHATIGKKLSKEEMLAAFQVLQEQFGVFSSRVVHARVHKCYRPMQWVPHATIGKKLSKEEMLAAFQVLQEQFGVFSSRVVQIGLAKTNPYEELWNLEL